MKAGTAQRITLNLISSLVMILLGRVHRGLMVDVQAMNEKLVRCPCRVAECLRIIARLQNSVRAADTLIPGSLPTD